jgi:peptidoglycan hydrolase CwlO-like protein
MSSITLALGNWWSARIESAAQRQLAVANDRIASLEEELEKALVQLRIQDLERNTLMAVNARNHQRVLKEMQDLGGSVPTANGPSGLT